MFANGSENAGGIPGCVSGWGGGGGVSDRFLPFRVVQKEVRTKEKKKTYSKGAFPNTVEIPSNLIPGW